MQPGSAASTRPPRGSAASTHEFLCSPAATLPLKRSSHPWHVPRHSFIVVDDLEGHCSAAERQTRRFKRGPQSRASFLALCTPYLAPCSPHQQQEPRPAQHLVIAGHDVALGREQVQLPKQCRWMRIRAANTPPPTKRSRSAATSGMRRAQGGGGERSQHRAAPVPDGLLNRPHVCPRQSPVRAPAKQRRRALQFLHLDKEQLVVLASAPAANTP